MLGLKGYGSSSSDSEDDDSAPRGTIVPKKSRPEMGQVDVSKLLVPLDSAAPSVIPPTNQESCRYIVDPSSRELSYNPKYQDLYAPVVGPINPHKSKLESAPRNMLSGYVEPAHVNDFQFDNQRKTFHSYGYAQDPSINDSQQDQKVVRLKTVKETELDHEMAPGILSGDKTVFEESRKRPLDKREREKNKDAADIEGFLGPWGKFVNEERVSKPNEEDAAYLEDYLSKVKKRAKKVVEEKPTEEKSVLHIKDPYDYQGRSFLHIPQDVGVNLKSENPPDRCFIPKRQIHVWQGHNKGVSVLKWFPQSAHLLLSGSMDNKVKLWEVFKNRRCVRTFTGHKQAVKDIDFNIDGSKFLSTGYDRMIKLWDIETGECVNRFSCRKISYCVKFHPDENKNHLVVAGTSDKKIICWDTRNGNIVQEYDRHLGAVNTVTFIDNNRRFVTTSDDKSLRVWEWGIPVDMKYIADPTMHSIPAVAKSPNHKWMLGQSLDNKISVFTCGDRFRPHKKEFKGHMAAGYACGMDFSPDMSYVISGDGDGKCCIWDFKSTKMVSKWKAHENATIDVLWHPHETSKVATAGWDGLIKYWD